MTPLNVGLSVCLSLSVFAAMARAQTPANRTTISGDNMIIEFDPRRSTKVQSCDQIAHVQFVRMLVGGKVVKPSEIDKNWTRRDATMSADGWTVDQSGSNPRPIYQEVAMGQQCPFGFKNASGSRPVTLDDGPNPTVSGGADVFLQFDSFAWCMKGGDCGRFYEGTRWAYKWSAKSGAKLDRMAPNLVQGPAAGQLEAFRKFNAARGYAVCSKTPAEEQCEPPR